MVELRKEEGNLIVQLQRELIYNTTPKIKQEVLEYLEQDQDWKELILDFEHTRTIDSAGINMVVSLYQKAHKLEKNYRVIHCNPAIWHVFEITRLTEKFLIEEK